VQQFVMCNCIKCFWKVYQHSLKAFDTVAHNKLLHKLLHYGIQSNVHQWNTTWLTCRIQKVLWRGILFLFVSNRLIGSKEIVKKWILEIRTPCMLISYSFLCRCPYYNVWWKHYLIQNSPAVKSVRPQEGHCEKDVKSKVLWMSKKWLWW